MTESLLIAKIVCVGRQAEFSFGESRVIACRFSKENTN